MAPYPSEQWLHEFCVELNESRDLKAFNFSEDVMLVLTDLGLDELTVSDLDDEFLAKLPRSVREGLADVPISEVVDNTTPRVRDSLPEEIGDLLDQTERNVIDDTIYIYIQLDEGSCFGPALVDDPKAVDVECLFRADASTWQSIVAGRPATAAALDGDLEILGNKFLLFKHLAELQLIGDIAADVETEFLFDRPGRSIAEFVVDESLRFPISLQKMFTREASLAMRDLNPF